MKNRSDLRPHSAAGAGPPDLSPRCASFGEASVLFA
jgi:hypothetical protein